VKRDLEQWFLRITDFAERLLNYDGLEWPERVMTMQRNWIGRSEGAELEFKALLPGGSEKPLPVFTTRPDTVFGATFMVLAPEHPLVADVTTRDRRAEVEAYIEDTKRETEIERTAADKEKTGVFTGGYCRNPFNGERIPLDIADYVLAGYGTGAIMAVPAHDQRDFDFATTYGIEIRPVYTPDGWDGTPFTEAMIGRGQSRIRCVTVPVIRVKASRSRGSIFCSSPMISVTSPPELKPRPFPVITSTRTSSRWGSSVSRSRRSA